MRDFQAVLLPNWVRFDLRQPVREPLTAAVSRMLSGVPVDAAGRVRPYLFEQLFGMLTQLATSGATAVFMSTDNPAEASAFPIFSVGPANFEVEGEPMEPLDYLIGLVGSGAATLIEPEGMVGVRRVTDRDTTAALRDGLANLPAAMAGATDNGDGARAVAAGRLSRAVEYVIGVPQSPDRWMVVTASISALGGKDDQELLDAVTTFADRWVENIRWTEEPADV